MAKKTLKNFLNDTDWHHAFFNSGTIYCLGKAGCILTESLFDINLDAYNSVEHLAIGLGIGTLAYRKTGGGVKGVLNALKWGTLFNLGWESLERYGGIYSETAINTISDILMVYGGNLLTPLIEKYKDKD
jgi:hypothetical protein